MPLDVRGQNYRSIFQQQIHFSISKPQHYRPPSVKRQTWTITISTEKRQTFVGLLFLTELPSKSFSMVKVSAGNRSKIATFSDAEMSHVPFGTSRYSKFFFTSWPCWGFTVCTQKNQHFPLSNSSLAPCCRLVDKAEKRMVKQRSRVFGWDDTPQTQCPRW